MKAVQIVGPSAWLTDRKTAVQRSINCYPMLSEDPGGDSTLVLESAPGLSLVHDFGADIRGIKTARDTVYVVAGSALYSVDSADAVSNLGALAGSGEAMLAEGTSQLAIVDGATLHVYNMDTAALTQVTTGGWLGSNVVDTLDGYFIFADPGTENVYISANDDGTTFDASEFRAADTQPDSVVSLIVVRRELYLMGSRSTEVWVDSGDPDFPFVRYQGTPIDVGIVGAYARCNANDSLVWVGQTAQGGPYVYQLQGYQPVRISTQSVEQRLQASTDLTATTLWSYQDAGGEFVVLDSPGIGTTWVWDASTKLWHERGEISGGNWTRSRIERAAYRNGVQYVAGGTKLYKMSRNYTSLAGDALIRERTWPHIIGESMEPVRFHSLELRCTTGEGGTITLENSNDGGSVWGSPLARSLGTTGQRVKRVRWMPLGTCPAGGSRVFRLRCSDAVPLTIQGAWVS